MCWSHVSSLTPSCVFHPSSGFYVATDEEGSVLEDNDDDGGVLEV